MRVVFCLFILLCGCVTAPLNSIRRSSPLEGARGNINSEMSFREVAENTYVVTDKIFMSSNVLVAAMPDGAVLIASSPFETQNANALVDWIIERFTPNRIVAINTHFHSDGTGGNDAFNKAGVETWASEETQALLAENGESMRKDVAKMFKNPDLRRRILKRKKAPAQHTFKQQEGLDLNFGSEQVRVMYPGPAHSPDNLVVYLPRRSVLFGGCMIRSFESKDLGYVGRADIERWPQSARNLLPLPLQVVVPGHGAVGGPELIEKTISLATEAQLKTKEKL